MGDCIYSDELVMLIKDYIKHCVETRRWCEQAGAEAVLDMIENVVAPSNVVPWEWLKDFAEGKRMNYASDFILEAQEAYNNGTD